MVDDGSTDGTVPSLKISYSEEPRIDFIQVENGERGRARNIGFDAAKGKYVIFLDSDDCFNEGAFSAFHRALLADESISFLCGKYFLSQADIIEKGPLSVMKPGAYDRDFLLRGNPVACNIVVKKDCSSYHPFQEDRSLSSMEDWIYLLQNITEHKLHLIDTYTVTMTDHDQRSMRNDHIKVVNARLRAKEFALKTVPMSIQEAKILTAFSQYFCAIHAYLGSNRTLGFKHIIESWTSGGPRIKLLILAIKSIAGRKLIIRLSSLRP